MPQVLVSWVQKIKNFFRETNIKIQESKYKKFLLETKSRIDSKNLKRFINVKTIGIAVIVLVLPIAIIASRSRQVLNQQASMNINWINNDLKTLNSAKVANSEAVANINNILSMINPSGANPPQLVIDLNSSQVSEIGYYQDSSYASGIIANIQNDIFYGESSINRLINNETRSSSDEEQTFLSATNIDSQLKQIIDSYNRVEQSLQNLPKNISDYSDDKQYYIHRMLYGPLSEVISKNYLGEISNNQIDPIMAAINQYAVESTQPPTNTPTPTPTPMPVPVPVSTTNLSCRDAGGKCVLTGHRCPIGYDVSTQEFSDCDTCCIVSTPTPTPTNTPTPAPDGSTQPAGSIQAGVSKNNCDGYDPSRGNNQCYCYPVSVSVQSTSSVCSNSYPTSASVTWNGANCLYCGYTITWTNGKGDPPVSKDYWVADADCNNKKNEISTFENLNTSIDDPNGIQSVSVMPYKTSQSLSVSFNMCTSDQNKLPSVY